MASSRRAGRLKNLDPARTNAIEGDVLDGAKLTESMREQDVVYANLAPAGLELDQIDSSA